MQNAIAKLENEHIMCLICARGPWACRRKKLVYISEICLWIEIRRMIGTVSLQSINWTGLAKNPPLLISSGALQPIPSEHFVS